MCTKNEPHERHTADTDKDRVEADVLVHESEERNVAQVRKVADDPLDRNGELSFHNNLWIGQQRQLHSLGRRKIQMDLENKHMHDEPISSTPAGNIVSTDHDPGTRPRD